MGKEITVCIKLFSGIDKELELVNYDPGQGRKLNIKKGARLKAALKMVGMRKFSMYIYFRNGERIGLWSKLKDEDEVSCLRPSGGG